MKPTPTPTPTTPTRQPVSRDGAGFADFDTVRISLATADDILNWSHGEVLKAETINYRTQKPERDGLFCERIFGPEKDINPHDARFKGVRSREAAVDKQGALVTKAIVRRERMGHIKLAAPVVHTWFLRTIPSPLAQVTGLKVKDLERIISFVDWLILDINHVGLEAHVKTLTEEIEQLDKQIKTLVGADKDEDSTKNPELDRLKDSLAAKQAELQAVEPLTLMTKHSRLAETDWRRLPEVAQKYLKVGMGGEAVYQMLQAIDLKQLIAEIEAEIAATKSDHQKRTLLHRLRVLEGIARAGVKIENMCLTVLPVIPPDLRPIIQLTGGKFAGSDLNDLYRRVIIRNNRLKNLIDLDAPDIICLNEKRMLQGAVDALIDNSSSRGTPPVTHANQNRKLKSLTDMLKGKTGRLRQNILGKRVDYSGRSVIVSGPRLRMTECGLPKVMALELFKNFVIGQIMADDPSTNFRAASRMVEEGRDNLVWDALDHVIKGKYVLLNRAPTLHRLSIQAFKPKLIEGKAIQLAPLVCKGFNADFDGDHMAVHLPLSSAAQKEARELMTPASNLLHPATGRPILHLDQDIIMGLYYLTYDKYSGPASQVFPDTASAIVARDQGQIELQTPIKLRLPSGEVVTTNLGRVLFNEILPDDFPFQNQPLNQRAVFDVMGMVYERYDWDQVVDVADALKDLAFVSATQSGLSLGIGDFMQFEGVEAAQLVGTEKVNEINRYRLTGHITEAERYRLVIKVWGEVDRQVRDLVADQFGRQPTSLKVIVDSEARGKINIDQIKRMMAMIGIQSDATGKALEMPITGSYFGGLSSLEYFVASRGGRKSLIDVALSTADSGYLTRRLVYVAQDLFTVDSPPDNDHGFLLTRADSETIGVAFSQRLIGRYSAGPVSVDGQSILKRGDLITKELAEQIEASDLQAVLILSVLTDTNLEGVSTKSYGLDPANGQLVKANHPVGVIAAQSIGEPSTQLKLDSRHSGGVASVTRHSVSTGLDRIIELFEARAPKGVGFIAEIDGEVSVQPQPDGSSQVTVQGPEDLTFSCRLPTRLVGSQSLVVAAGDSVEKDQTVLVGSDQSVVLAPVGGQVLAAQEDDEGLVVVIKPPELMVETHKVSAQQEVLVKTGQKVKRGAVLTTGSLALDRLLAVSGLVETQRYILTEISRVFMSQNGNHIADKHLEGVIRQMFSRVRIVNAGDSRFVDGDFVSLQSLIQINQQLIAAGQKPATWVRLVLGIAKISGLSDSFLNAASFQNTTQVLVRSAIWGRVDKLRGLTENVILGRKIPIGTGVEENQPAEEVLEPAAGSEVAPKRALTAPTKTSL